MESGSSSEEGSTGKAHSIHGIATSSAFFKNWSISSVLDVASWKSNSVLFHFILRIYNLFMRDFVSWALS